MKVFLSGIGGTGMSSLAGLFSMLGYQVYGSDNNFYPPVDGILKKMQVKLFSPYQETNIPQNIDFCVIGNVVGRGNPEAEYILNNKIEYYSMAQALYKFFIKGKESVVVAGTHGKTTVATMVSFILDYAGLNPGYFIGGKPLDLPANYSRGSGRYFVAEGDEYETSFFDRSSKFLKYHPKFLLLTSLEYDHIDFFRDEEMYLYSFKNLVNQVPSNGLVIINNDYKMNKKAVENTFSPVISYGTHQADYLITGLRREKNLTSFTLRHKNIKYSFSTSLIGEYNIWNFTAAIILVLNLKVDMDVIKNAVAAFTGVSRRLNKINTIDQTIFYEDFAHHPTSISYVLKSIRKIYPEYRIISLFEPRSWSLRKNYFLNSLKKSFQESDVIFIKEVFNKEQIPKDQRLNTGELKNFLAKQGKEIFITDEYSVMKEFLINLDKTKKNICLLISNGSFGDIPGFVKKMR